MVLRTDGGADLRYHEDCSKVKRNFLAYWGFVAWIQVASACSSRPRAETTRRCSSRADAPHGSGAIAELVNVGAFGAVGRSQNISPFFSRP
jgi:hypothetical protein